MNAFFLRRFAIGSCIAVVVGIGALASASAPTADKPPAVGDIAKNFTLGTLSGEQAQLLQLQQQGPVVLLVLRGYPGYQCPICNTQVGQFVASANKFAALKANVVLVYPGPAEGLKEHAEDFVRGKTLPSNFYLALDPDYNFLRAYGLRWEANHETAYPSTFVIGPDGRVQFAKVSATHGGRATAEEVLKVLSDK